MARDKMDKGASFMEKKSFLRSGEGSIASYSWSDLITQVGYANFYGMTVLLTSGEEKIMPTEIMKSHSNYISGSCNYLDDSGEVGTLQTSQFSSPLTLDTEVYVTFRWVMYRKLNGGSDHKIRVSVLKNDTELGNTEGETHTLTDSDEKQGRSTFKINLSEDTRIQIGDIVKVKFEVTFESGDDDVYLDVYTDPLDQSHTNTNPDTNVTVDDSQLLIKLPFKIEL